MLGSRTFLHDISGAFVCDENIDPFFPIKGCAAPFRPDLSFTRLCARPTLVNGTLHTPPACFASVLEMRQVGWPSSRRRYNTTTDGATSVTNSTLYAHTQPEQRAVRQ